MATTNPSFEPQRPATDRGMPPRDRIDTPAAIVTPTPTSESVRASAHTRSKPDLRQLDRLDTAAFLLAALMTLGPLAAYSFGWGA